ncbi:hypothetical protein ACQ4PT_054388 [Festuca glaucescens]
MVGHALLLVGFVLTAQLCGCTAYVGGGFSVEFIHRDSAKSPFHDPKLTVHGRVLAAARRSTARAAALARSYTSIGSPAPDGAVSEIISRPFEYLMYVNVVNFGCATSINGAFFGNGVVGLGAGNMSLISQIGGATSLGRRFSYCLVPYYVNASSALNFGSRAAVTEVDAVTTPMVPSESYYTVALECVEINNSTFTLPLDRSHLIVDSGTSMTYLPQRLLDQMAEEVNRTIKLPQVSSTGRILPLCYDATGMTEESILEKMIPDVKLVMGGGAVVTLKARTRLCRWIS